MVKGKGWVSFDGKGIGVEGDYVDSVSVVFDETADGDALVVEIIDGGRGR